MQYICKICGKTFENNTKNNITKIFKKHLKEVHNLDIKNYIIQYYYNGKLPTCACGCGEKTKWIGKNALWDEYHGFTQFCSCTHVNGIPHKHSEEFKIHYKCLECGKDFGLVNKSASFKILKHIRKDHNISLEEYCLKHYYNNEYPKCACGCGQILKFNPKNALWSKTHGFGKYVNCGHVGRNNEQLRNKFKENYKSKYDNIEWIKQYYYDQYGQDNIENSAKDFLENNDLTNIDIGKKYGIDVRTLKSIWNKLSLVTNQQWKERCLYRKYNLSGKRRKKKFENKDQICKDLFDIMKNNPFKYNIRSLLEYYNSNNLTQIETDIPIILEELENIYGDKIYQYLEYNKHSKEEKEFLNIIKFFLGKKNIYKCGFRLQYGKNKRESYIYDICIDNKYIIEYDGIFYHNENNKDRDIEKENFAINNGYKFLRISSKDFRNIDKYKEILNFINYD